MTPIQAGIETDHDLLEFDFVARILWPGLVGGRNLRTMPTISNQLTLKTSNCRLYRAQLSVIAYHVTRVLTPAGLSLRLESGTQTRHRGLTRKFDICWRGKNSLDVPPRSTTALFYLEKFRILRKESKALINRKLKEYHTSIGDSLKVNPKRFWSLFRHKTKSNSIPAFRTEGDRSARQIGPTDLLWS